MSVVCLYIFVASMKPLWGVEGALACVREICFDRLGVMFDGKVPFLLEKKKIVWSVSYMPP